MAVEPVGDHAHGQAEGHGGDGQDPQDRGHGDGLPAMVGGLGATAAEGQEPQPGGVRGGEYGGQEAGDEHGPAGGGRGDVPVTEGGVLGGDENGFLGEEAGERRDGGQREEGDRHRPVGVGNALGQASHAGHGGQRVGAGGVDDDARCEEEDGFERAVRDEVEDGGAAVPDGQGA